MISKFILAFLGGLIPVFIWLWFWEHEDKHPEPKRLIGASFVAGMICVALAIPLERFIMELNISQTGMFIWWAIIEECLKFAAAYLVALRLAENDEPIDATMYLIATALGFAALENALFILQPILDNQLAEMLITLNFRFIGATVLHIIASSTIGIFLAASFYRSRSTKLFFAGYGLFTAIVLHAFFNLSIIISNGSATLYSFYAVWVAVIAMLLVLERVKSIKKPSIYGKR